MSNVKPNSEQIEYWNGDAGAQWSDRDDEMDAMLRPLGEEAMSRANLAAGEAVLDIGCGCGATTFLLAHNVGEHGRVEGVDISAPMLATARKKLAALPEAIRKNVSFTEADASIHDFAPAQYDVLFSRFGIMFFDDPVAAFSNLRKALKPDGRLAFLCWGPIENNEWITVPARAAMALLPSPESAELPDPREPGPFAFADPEYLAEVLGRAGFSAVEAETYSPVMRIGTGRDIAGTAEFFMDIGPVSRGLQGQDESLRERVREAIVAAISDRYTDGALELGGRCWIVTAENS